MRFTTNQFMEKEVITMSCRNKNASAAILDGQLVYYLSYDKVLTDGEFDPGGSFGNNADVLGVDVANFATVNALTGVTSPFGLMAGIYKSSQSSGYPPGTTVNQLPANAVGEMAVYGFIDAIVTRRSRTASTISWASTASFGAGDQLVGESVGGYLGWSQTAAAGIAVDFIAGQSQPSLASFTSNSNTGTGVVGGTSGTLETCRMKVFCSLL